jgi:hypothetical protein
VGRNGKDKTDQLFWAGVDFPALDVLELRLEFGELGLRSSIHILSSYRRR